MKTDDKNADCQRAVRAANLETTEMADEVWAYVSSRDDFAVSDMGRVAKIKSTRASKAGLRGGVCPKGYVRVRIGKKMMRVHRLVAEAFIPNPNGLESINHKDGNKTNNRASNLEWCTCKENSIHSVSVLGNGVGSKNGMAKLTESSIYEIRRLISMGVPNTRIADAFGVTHSIIRDVRKGITWRHVA
jgi:hypothetical protein